MEHRVTKICTKCLAELSLDHYYSKGNRIDSRCKSCVKSTKKSKYVAKEQILRVDSLFKIFALISELEISILNNQIQRLDKEIERCQQRQIQL
jgi:hypothetical protein